ncbi:MULTISPECIES: class I SAM-dependent DNA methyltransferase [Virgibacillus]|uniref:Uncharacterized methyltransferase BN990_03081 n=2 Tax=Virgibacillus TaxID=84406 RepID=A0A024QDX7_9BACI|nr:MULTISPECIES: class I SAM-dependent methyltransferase [Virgibacillus]EQB35085.1 hypothetical protein M948_18475 [Virgibacillus sp. CM-4]MYL42858.1 methyltransferase domain-containing protein [Virgibacillus massiliensis]GGJ70030.1 putative methyltransferase YrrT [Virgibacillus kapii]CDQ40753.1 putative methyltransferase YrrT [Virgibacillus massiliensis]
MGREFLSIFDDWANQYDDSVAGMDPQYARVFANYNHILDTVVSYTEGSVLEFGIGTGNLSQKLIEAGHEFVGVEPSLAMREIANKKLPNVQIVEGDFLHFPAFTEKVDTIVSTYAFHHLTDTEKESAIKQFSELLPIGGKVVFGDTVFITEEKKHKEIDHAKKHGYMDLAEDLQREYYPTVTVLKSIFTLYNFDIAMKQMNDFVWLIVATKK